MNVDDLYLILHHHWVVDTAAFPDGRQCLQVAFIELIIAGSATRPAALVYVRKNEKRITSYCIGENDEEEDGTAKGADCDSDWDDIDAKTLCYGNVSLILLPNPGSIRDLLAMELDICHTKGHKRKPKRCVVLPTLCAKTNVKVRKIFVQTEVDDLIFDPVILMITLALLDDAFESNIRLVEDIFRTRVRPPRRSVHLRFKKSMHNIPIFRQAMPSVDGVRTSPTKALRYHTFLYYLQRLGMATGMI